MRSLQSCSRVIATAAMLLATSVFASAEGPFHSVSAADALTRLKEGNARYVEHRQAHPDQSAARLAEVEQGQHPFAVVLGCADSRVPPEIVFDQGLGDLFVIRVAGAVPDDEIIGSVEYAVEHLHTELVVVLGHEKCGAVTAAASGVVEDNHTQSFVKGLQPAVEEARQLPGDLVHNAVCVSVDQIVRQLQESEPVLARGVVLGKVKVVGARYDLHTGQVIWHKPASKPAGQPTTESE